MVKKKVSFKARGTRIVFMAHAGKKYRAEFNKRMRIGKAVAPQGRTYYTQRCGLCGAGFSSWTRQDLKRQMLSHMNSKHVYAVTTKRR